MIGSGGVGRRKRCGGVAWSCGDGCAALVTAAIETRVFSGSPESAGRRECLCWVVGVYRADMSGSSGVLDTESELGTFSVGKFMENETRRG